MDLSGREEAIVVSVKSGKVRNRECRERAGNVNTVVFSLRSTGVMELEIREVRSRVAHETIADLACG